MFGIAGYAPRAADRVDQVLGEHGSRLHALAGRRLESVTGLCFLVDGAWCCTGPLILDFGGPRLELAFEGFDEMCLSWNTIDTGTPLDTPDQDDPDLALGWGDPRQAELDAVRRAVVGQVRVLENDFRLERADGQLRQAWLLAGLEFVFLDGRARQLYNVFSELTLAADPQGSEGWRRHTVGGGKPI